MRQSIFITVAASLILLFLSEWDFFSQSDPTNGLVDYQTKQAATSKGLAYVQDDGTTILKVDNTTTLQSGQNRAS